MTPAEILALAIAILTAVLALLSWLQPMFLPVFLTIFGAAAGTWALLRLRPAVTRYRSVKRSPSGVRNEAVIALFDVVFAIVVLSVTIVYLGMLGFSLWYAYSPVYADLFQKLLDWSAIPTGLWGLYVGYQIRGATIAAPLVYAPPAGWMSEGKYFAIALGVAVLVVLIGVGIFILWPSGATMLLMIPIAMVAPVIGILVANSLDHP
jgi:hypothetical protein